MVEQPSNVINAIESASLSWRSLIAIESGNDADFGNDGHFESVIGGLASAIWIASGSENHPPEIKS